MSGGRGNEATWERDQGLRAIAEARWQEPLSSWPEHEKVHDRTLMGARLFDSECLRCHMESVAAGHYRAIQKYHQLVQEAHQRHAREHVGAIFMHCPHADCVKAREEIDAAVKELPNQ